MKATGIVRRIDELGRVVVPKEIRRTLRIREGDPLEIFTNRDGEVILKKYSPIGELDNFAKQYAEALGQTSGQMIMICDRRRQADRRRHHQHERQPDRHDLRRRQDRLRAEAGYRHQRRHDVRLSGDERCGPPVHGRHLRRDPRAGHPQYGPGQHPGHGGDRPDHSGDHDGKKSGGLNAASEKRHSRYHCTEAATPGALAYKGSGSSLMRPAWTTTKRRKFL